MHWVGSRQCQLDQRVAHLVVGDHLALLRIMHAVLLLQAGNDALHRPGEILQGHLGGRAARGAERSFVDQIGQIGAGKTGGQRRDLVEVDRCS